jgi:hypothetical protein
MQVSRVLPMSSDYSVTYVPGLYRPRPNVRRSSQAIYGLRGLRPRSYFTRLQLNLGRYTVTT